MTQLRPRGPRTAFVLGGGGNLGAVQVGMLRALLERGITPDLVVGCSVGAVNGVGLAVAPDMSGVEFLERTWKDPGTAEVFGGRFTPLALFRKAPSMVGSEKLRSMLEGYLADRNLEDLPVPTHIVATSLRTGRERWYDRGPAVPVVLASAALPAVLPPVHHDGDVLIDGGVVDNVPVARAAALGAERIVVLHVGNIDKPRPAPKRPIDVLLQAFSIARNHRFAADIETAAAGSELVVLPGVDPGALKRNDFSRSAELMTRAKLTSGAYLDGLALAASS